VDEQEKRPHRHTDAKRLTNPVTISSFENLLAKFIGEKEAQQAIAVYLEDKQLENKSQLSEFELPNVIFHEHSATCFSRPFHQARRSELCCQPIT